jgi:hypothetical protein
MQANLAAPDHVNIRPAEIHNDRRNLRRDID